MGNENNKEKGSGFFLIGIVCGLIVVIYLIMSIIKAVSYEFKHHTEDTMGIVIVVGVISIVIYKLLNSSKN